MSRGTHTRAAVPRIDLLVQPRIYSKLHEQTAANTDTKQDNNLKQEMRDILSRLCLLQSSV
jgi:hypothetical protein